MGRGGGGGIPSHSYPVSAPSSQQFRRGLGGTCEEGGKPGFKPCLACRCRHHPGIRQQRRKRTSLHQTCPMLLWLAEEQVEKAEEGLFAGSVPAVPFPPFSRHFLRERQKLFREPGLPKAEKVGGGVGWWAKFSSYAALLRHYRTLTSFLLVISKPSPLAARLFSSPHLAAVFWSAVLLAYAKMGMPLLGGRRIRSSGVGSWSPNHCKVAERAKKKRKVVGGGRAAKSIKYSPVAHKMKLSPATSITDMSPPSPSFMGWVCARTHEVKSFSSNVVLRREN